MCKISYKKFEYSLNAMLYCIWLINIQEENFAGKVVDALFSPILKYLFTKEHKQIYNERISNKNKCYYIGSSFNFLCSSYLLCLLSIILGFVFKYVEDVSLTLIFLTAGIPTVICHMLLCRAVFSKNRYIKYFKRFDKENEQWHRKWERRAIILYVCGIISPFLGIGFMWCMLFLF